MVICFLLKNRQQKYIFYGYKIVKIRIFENKTLFFVFLSELFEPLNQCIPFQFISILF